MWLINVRTRTLEEYFGSNTPPYAILSHTWEEEEVSYKQYVAGDYLWMKGFKKIDMTCRIAQQDDIDYAWVDTCCIDKSSSAELSEAINSMFRWYRRAKVCFVYLSDLPNWSKSLGSCRWFTRGWTLQELIAPPHVRFYDSEWRSPQGCTKSDLAGILSDITKIDRRLLQGQRTLNTICVAQKMSWAANRTTTRIEDTAYCLLGIFDLNMPLLYGEEEKAFRRLQEEIIRSTVDLSILAWSLPPSQDGWPSNDTSDRSIVNREEPYLCGLLAKSPADFWACGQYEGSYASGLREFTTSNIGIRTRARLHGISRGDNSCSVTLPLSCKLHGIHLGVSLKQVRRSTYLRQGPWALHTYGRESLMTFPPLERYLLSDLSTEHTRSASGLTPVRLTMQRIRKYALRMQTSVRVLPETLRASLTLEQPWPADRYDYEDAVFMVSRDPDHDFAIIDVTFTVFEDSQSTVKCTIIALGWSETYTSWPQFGIVPYDGFAAALGPLRNQDLESWQRQQRSKDVATYLKQRHVPRALSVQKPIGGTRLAAIVSIEPTSLHDLNNNVSQEVCYDLKVCAQIIQADRAPPVLQKQWDLDASAW